MVANTIKAINAEVVPARDITIEVTRERARELQRAPNPVTHPSSNTAEARTLATRSNNLVDSSSK